MARAGIKVVRVENGDRHVIEEMRAHGYNLGGEQSGHLVFFDHTTTGDGTISALQILRIMKETGKPLSELARCMASWPQVVKNIHIREKRPFAELHKVKSAMEHAAKLLGDDGRLLVRYSGTEQKVRIMVEGKESNLVHEVAEKISAAFQEEAGG